MGELGNEERGFRESFMLPDGRGFREERELRVSDEAMDEASDFCINVG
jgi:hypothetical protein